MSNFITNSKTETLKKRITELITTSKELRFLVGFFYFSGIRELYDGLKNREDLDNESVEKLSFNANCREFKANYREYKHKISGNS